MNNEEWDELEKLPLGEQADKLQAVIRAAGPIKDDPRFIAWANRNWDKIILPSPPSKLRLWWARVSQRRWLGSWFKENRGKNL